MIAPHPSSLALALALVLAGSGACFSDTPIDGSASQGSGSSTSSAATSDAATSTTAASDAASGTSAATSSSGGASTSTSDASGGVVTTSGEPSTSSGDASSSTTGAPLPDPLVLPVAIAACVYLADTNLPYGGPDECEANSTDQNGTMAVGVISVDLEAGPGGGREARIYIQVPIPPELEGVSIAAATLRLKVADGGAADGNRGDLYQTEPFTAMSLSVGAAEGVALLVPDPGPLVLEGEEVTWPIDPSLIIAGDRLHLGLFPKTIQSALFLGSNAVPDDRPTLTLDLE